ncbi:alanine racemase [uncultured Kiloniella sp.]|uniref:alanine racemase n=1 Tax=uncultured Kiloniella sp. TaxID=1133091 RepID=UPI00263438F1|nr:alanine racemase [uncultured Kiloniella sp.]
MPFDTLTTPALLLDKDVFEENCRVMQERAQEAGVKLRPHMKTAKALEAYHCATKDGFAGITVSTLAEADFFANGGVTDILYAVGIVPSKLSQAQRVQDKGVKLTLITDNPDAISLLGHEAKRLGTTFPVLIEVDSGGRRGGVLAGSQELLSLAEAITRSQCLSLEGVMTHAGHSYHVSTPEEIAEIAEQEREAVVSASARLLKAGFSCSVVSAGSTPTAVFAKSYEGLTEIRPGVYMFGDVDQMFIGACKQNEIAATVLASVIGHNKTAKRLLIDAGGLALSKDVSASEFSSHTGYGLVCGVDGEVIEELYVESVHQEHGLIASISGDLPYEKFPVGSRLRILPIHTCMTCAGFSHYEVHNAEGELLGKWERVNRW